MIRLSHILITAGFLALPLTANAAQNVDAYQTSCAANLQSMGKYSIDGVITLLPVIPAPDGSPLFVNNDTMVAAEGVPETLAVIRKSRAPAWLALRFKPTIDAVAGYLNSTHYDILSGFVINIVIAHKGGCEVTAETPQNIKDYPSLVLTQVYINQKLIQPDGSYDMMTPDLVKRAFGKTDGAKYGEIRTILTRAMHVKYGNMLKPASN